MFKRFKTSGLHNLRKRNTTHYGWLPLKSKQFFEGPISEVIDKSKHLLIFLMPQTHQSGSLKFQFHWKWWVAWMKFRQTQKFEHLFSKAINWDKKTCRSGIARHSQNWNVPRVAGIISLRNFIWHCLLIFFPSKQSPEHVTSRVSGRRVQNKIKET